jgi:hypothetical protein
MLVLHGLSFARRSKNRARANGNCGAGKTIATTCAADVGVLEII